MSGHCHCCSLLGLHCNLSRNKSQCSVFPVSCTVSRITEVNCFREEIKVGGLILLQSDCTLYIQGQYCMGSRNQLFGELPHQLPCQCTSVWTSRNHTAPVLPPSCFCRALGSLQGCLYFVCISIHQVCPTKFLHHLYALSWNDHVFSVSSSKHLE